MRLDATTLVDIGAYYHIGSARTGLDLVNMLASKDADITYYYTSRRQWEPAGRIDDVHLHPVEPWQLRISA